MSQVPRPVGPPPAARRASSVPSLALACAVLLAALLGGPAGAAIKLRYMTAVYADGSGKPFDTPEGVACNGSRLVVADSSGGRLVTFSVDGETITPAGEIVLPQLPSPIRARFDSKGNLLVLDGKLRRIGRVSASGAFTGYVDAAPGGAFVPRSFALDRADVLYVLDVAGGRVVILDAQDKVTKAIALPPESGFFSDLAVDGKGTVYALDSVGRRVFAARKDQAAFSPLGADIAADADFPTALAVDEAGHLFASDQDGGTILVLGPDGAVQSRQSGPGWKTAFLRAPSQLCLDGHGRLMVADRDNKRVQVFAMIP